MLDNQTRLMQLERELEALDRNKCSPMSLSELDGFLTGLVIHPYPFDSIDWMALVFNVHGREQDDIFNGKAHAQRVMDRIHEHTETIANSLENFSTKYEPLFEENLKTGEVNWKNWIKGFDKISNIHPEAWNPIISDSEESHFALFGFKLLSKIATGQTKLKKSSMSALIHGAHLLIPDWVMILSRAQKKLPVEATKFS